MAAPGPVPVMDGMGNQAGGLCVADAFQRGQAPPLKRQPQRVDRLASRLAADENDPSTCRDERLPHLCHVLAPLSPEADDVVEEAPEHADSVIELRVAVVGLRGRHADVGAAEQAAGPARCPVLDG